jgi:hypothetical protein
MEDLDLNRMIFQRMPGFKLNLAGSGYKLVAG